MTTSKAANFECCMCGDCGLSCELFRCKVCQFRSQHRYCSNLYPKAKSYSVCNWCLIDAADKTSNSSNDSSSPYKTSSEEANRPNHGKSKKKSNGVDHHRNHVLKGQIKKQRSLEVPPAVGWKRIVAGTSVKNGSTGEERLIRRTKSDEMTNGSGTGITKHVLRNKVRRYKLLDEISS
ncbi:hypothetical protein Nepgr_024278 [Nepenthes gracilis]|uniref:PHD-type zinc finger plants domain-containing protein n=1 Tax=Nepenthes gracilis TaxID=150966 RepID=A0AAD3T3Z9_NEPGR|nr:hypothetical protein Nepgr_024278 [Nepenthes gracilis]